MAKVHLRDTITAPDAYANSPNVVKTIQEGKFTVCRIRSERLTGLKKEVTCNRCLLAFQSQQSSNPDHQLI